MAELFFGDFRLDTNRLALEGPAGRIEVRAKTLELLHRSENEQIFAIQIFSANPATAVEAVTKLAPFSPDLFDLNCGCSVPKVLKSGCGAALLKNPELIGYYMNFIGISRCLERIGDLSTNIAEDVIYLVSGEIVRH